MSWARLWSIIRKEVRQIRRDRATLALVLAIPAMQLLLFGYALNTVEDHLATAVYDQSHTASSRGFAEAFQNTGYFDIHLWTTSREDALRAIDSGAAKVALIIPPDFGDQVLKGQQATAQLVVDGSDPNVAQTALFAGGLAAQSQSASFIADVASRMGLRTSQGGVELRPVVLYNPRMVSATFMVPALVGIIIQLQAVLLTAFAVVRERERGTLEQLIVSPVRPFELMAGKILPNIVLAVASTTLALVLARVLFAISPAGSLLTLYLMTLPFLLGSLGIGLVVSVFSKTQTQALQMAVFTLLPSIFLSGFVFSREGMPLVFQGIGLLVPLTYYLEIVRGVVLKGVGWSVLWPQFLALTAFGAGMLAIAASRFRKTLE